MKIAYFDCFAGASGDMILGSLIDAGLPADQLKAELAKLHFSHYDLSAEKVHKKGMGATQASVTADADHQAHRHLSRIRAIIENSGLDPFVKQKSIEIFTRLARAEAKIHQTDIEHIHFHEVGATDAIIDIVGSVAGISLLGIERIFCSPLHVGTGTVKCAHGILPVPAPATLELVRGTPIYSSGIQGELLTPTGAAILTTVSEGFGPLPPMTAERIGYGAGTSDREIPNLLRVIIGETDCPHFLKGFETEQVAVIETGIDDMNPQIYDYLIQKLLAMGVMDAFLMPLQMKKNRPGTLITVICPPEMVGEVSNFLMRETTTIGVRWRTDSRIKAPRTVKEIQTCYGTVKVKIAGSPTDITNISPEYEDCKRIALEKQIPLKTVMEEARRCISDF
jgi:uncharacterized protein (TIGR00299 family) protein